MIDLYLRAESEQQATDLLTQAGLLTQVLAEIDGDTVISEAGYQPAEGVTYDPIGVIYEPGTYDEAGEEITAPVALEGWHVNVRTADPLTEEQAETLLPIVLQEPNKPVRVFG